MTSFILITMTTHDDMSAIDESLKQDLHKIEIVVETMKRKFEEADEIAKKYKKDYDIWTSKHKLITMCLAAPVAAPISAPSAAPISAPASESDSESDSESESESESDSGSENTTNLMEEFLKVKGSFNKELYTIENLEIYCNSANFTNLISSFKLKTSNIILPKMLTRLTGVKPVCKICNVVINHKYYRIGLKKRCTHPECLVWLISKIVN